MNNWIDILPGATGFAGVIGGLVTAFKSKKFRAFLGRVLDSDGTLDNRIQITVASAVSALESALEVRGEELARVEAELAELRGEVAKLRTSDRAKDSRIKELEREVEELRAENAELRVELARRRGGRPKKETT